MNKLLAIDPGSNKCGLAWFNNGALIKTDTRCTTSDTPLSRRLEITDELDGLTRDPDLVVSEEPLLLGRNNNGMQRLLGMIERLTNGKVVFVHPMTLKKFMGSGSSDKFDMALAAGAMLKTGVEQDLLADAINREAWDETDAVCVGLWALNK